MILYDYDSNAQPIKDRTAPELLKAFQIMEQVLVARGLTQKLMKLDNEASKLLKTYLHQQDITFQLVPPYSHMRNSAEGAIRSFKDSRTLFNWQVISNASVGQIITTSSHNIEHVKDIKDQSQTFSGHTHFWTIWFQQSSNGTPRNKNHSQRRTWASLGQDGWYLGPALEHHRCYTVYITKTWGDRFVETVDFFPEKFTLPFPKPQDLATQAAADLTRALLHPQPAGPFCQVDDAQTLALTCLAAIFEGATQRKTKINAPPTEKEDTNAPPRVRTYVSSSQQTTRLNSEFTSTTKKYL
jgi:hypothetical protein